MTPNADSDVTSANNLVLAFALMAPTSLRAYIGHTFPDYDLQPHHQLLIDRLEAVERGEVKRLMVFMPPQRGKSECVSVRFPAWYHGRHPERNVMQFSYGADLTYDFSRQVRDQIALPEWPFPDVQLKAGEKSVGQWGLAGHRGRHIANGVLGGATGKGAHLAIIDDPVKNDVEAKSPIYQERVWQWYNKVVRTRMSGDGAIVLCMCMTGDTPVRMSDGTERPLRDIRPGDVVATYRRGELAVSTVQNHASQGHDNVYKITMTSGKIVYANERHPFLVERYGQRRWMRLRDLTTGQRIVTVRDSGASGGAASVRLSDAASPLVAGASVHHITLSKNGPMGTVLPRLFRRIVGGIASSTDTASPVRNTMRWWLHRMASAPSASFRPERMFGRIGAGSSALIIATKPELYGGFFATIATSPSATPNRRQPPPRWSNISDFTTEAIVSIEAAGIAEVFDVQIADTENFIANGLVSHNTRWDDGDLAGRLLDEARRGGDQWEVITLKELAEEGDGDPLGRAPGEPLWPSRFPAETTAAIRLLQPHTWEPLYQQRPGAVAGGMFKRDWMANRYDPAVLPHFGIVVQTVDSAFKDDTAADWSVVATWGATLTHFYLLDVYRAKLQFPDLLKAVADQYAKWQNLAPWVYVEDKASGQSAIQQLRRGSNIPVIAFNPGQAPKASRAQDATPYFAAGRVLLPESAPWLADWIEEHVKFPGGMNDDQVDCTSMACKVLARATGIGLNDLVTQSGDEPRVVAA